MLCQEDQKWQPKVAKKGMHKIRKKEQPPKQRRKFTSFWWVYTNHRMCFHGFIFHELPNSWTYHVRTTDVKDLAIQKCTISAHNTTHCPSLCAMTMGHVLRLVHHILWSFILIDVLIKCRIEDSQVLEGRGWFATGVGPTTSRPSVWPG